MSVIEFTNVSKRFILNSERRNSMQEWFASIGKPRPPGDEFWALRDVSFEVEKGKSIGLVGHNGAGKSTALKLMTRILEPTTGSVRLEGRVAALLELGSGFHPDLSGRDNVFLYGSLMGLSRKDMARRLDSIVDFAEIGRFFDMEVKHYSSGMYTRLAFAVATEVDPDVLITDEVLAVGDEAFQRRCMERIYRFRRRGKTIVFVSHALDVVRTLCDTAVWLDRGEMRAYANANDVVDAYLDEVNRRESDRIAALRRVTEQTDTPEENDIELGNGLVRRRYGSREVEITRVTFVDVQGRPHEVFRTNEPLVVRIHYHAHQPVNYPLFGIGFHHGNGLWLTGPNTSFDGVDIPHIDGEGYVDYVVPSLPLLTGTYTVTVAVFDESHLHPFDVHDHSYELVVHTGSLRERYGTMTFGGHWLHSADVPQPAIETTV